VQEVRWEGGGTEPAGEYTFLYRKGNENHELGTGILCIRESYQHYLVVAKVRERLAVNRERSHRFHMEKFNLKKLKEVEDKEQYHVEV
jgi:hypothetical protein